MRTALTIAGSDPSGWAGIQADLKAFSDMNVRGLSAITAITAQDGKAVAASAPVTARLLAKQIETLLGVFEISAVKIGMIGSSENLRAITRIIRKYGIKNAVLDTVTRSTSGRALLDRAGVKNMRLLMPLVKVVTPNIPEASALTGEKITGLKGMEEAARNIHSMGAPFVLVKGGHLKGDPIDLLFDGKKVTLFKGKRLKGRKEVFHGTGCVLSAAIAAGLAKGLTIEAAVKAARAYLTAELRKRARA